MAQDKDIGDLVGLRKRAEQSARREIQHDKDISALSRKETQRLVHELQIYQIELEMQNVDLRRAQQDLEESRDNYAALYDFAPVGYFTLDDKGVIRQVNLTGANLLCMDRQYLVNTPFVVFVGKKSRAAFYYHLRNVLESQTRQTCEIDLEKKNSGTFHARLESLAQVGLAGEGLECRTVISDITDRKRAEDALRKGEAKYRQLIENAQEGIWAIDSEARTTFVNPRMAEMLGYTAEEMIGRLFFDFLDGEAKARYRTHQQRRQQGISELYDLQLLRKDGNAVDVLINASPVLDDSGKFTGALGFISDISDRKRAENALQAAHDQLEARNAELDSFTYSVSHDLRAPLRSITGFSEIIARRHRDGLNEEGQRYVDNIVHASRHMERLIEDLLAYSRIGRKGQRRQGVPLRSVMTQILEDLSNQIAQSNAEIIMPRKLPVVSGDPTLLFRIFANLIDNALKYRRPHVRPEVTVSCKRDGDHVVVRVADNGVGIPAECHKKVFDLFQRLHSHDEVPGTGVGLAIMKKAVHAIGGQVWLESTAGEGTTFYVKLPAESGKGKETRV